MISIYYDAYDPYRVYGFDHFIEKYGIKVEKKDDHFIVYLRNEAKNSKKIDLILRISNNEIQNEICGYLKTKAIEAPVFETPIRLEIGEPLVMYSVEGNDYPCVTLNENIISIGFDVFNEIGRILSGHLEQFWKSKTQVSQQMVKVPVIDFYEKMLFDCILLACEKLDVSLDHKPFWPGGKQFALCLTHDVDRVNKTFQYFTHPIKKIRKGDFYDPLNQFKSLIKKFMGNEPYWMFDKIIDIEMRFGVKSTFFFLNEKGKLKLLDPKSWILFSGRYSITDTKIINLMKELHQNGWEIGVHGSYNSHSNSEQINIEKNMLEFLRNNEISGIRQHYCNLTIPDTWEFQEAAGFRYDTSLCVKKDVGFRWGTCFPFYPFNSIKEKRLNILEIPLIIMDGALFGKEDPWHECKKIVDIVEHYGGLLMILWHNHVFNENDFPGMVTIYEELITLCKKRGAWVSPAGEIEQWWNSR